MLREIAAHAMAAGRPLGAAVSVPWDTRRQIAPHWVLHGMVYLPDSQRTESLPSAPGLDLASTERVVELLKRSAPRGAPEGRDPAARYIDHLLHCPERVLERGAAASRDTTESLDSICNFR